MFLNPEIIAMLIINFIFFIFSLIAMVLSTRIFLFWDFEATSKRQYLLEKQSYLASTIIKYIFILKVPLFLFFVYTLDNMSEILVGVMCAAGVINATTDGTTLFILKITNMYLFGFWLLIHYSDIQYANLKFTKFKSIYFMIMFFVFMTELYLEVIMYASIDLEAIAACCGVIYSDSTTTLISDILALPHSIILTLFYGMFGLNLLSYYFKQMQMYSITNIFFLVLAIFSLISYFSPYIYELPTHHCPFCILQKEYNYVGYIIYIFLFVGTFNGIASMFMNTLNLKNYNLPLVSIVSNTIYVLIVSFYPILYYFTNGVWLY